MPKTKRQTVFFAAITAWMMVYCMTLYNIVLSSNDFTNRSFWSALSGMWIEYIIILLCAIFIASPLAKKLAFRIVKPSDRPIAIVISIQVFTVVIQVAVGSLLGVIKMNGLGAQVLPCYLTAYCRNFLLAMPLQLLLVGPIARWIFRKVCIKVT